MERVDRLITSSYFSLAWVQHHRPSNDQMNQIWQSFKAADLNSRYLWDLKNHLVDDLQYSLDDHHLCNNKIACYSFSCNTIQLRNMKESWHVWFGCPVKHCVHSRNHAVKLQIQNDVPLYLIDKKIKYPAPTKVTFRHYHPGAVIHWWGWTDTWKYRKISQFKDLTEFDSMDDEYCRRSFVSMVTNSIDEFIEKLNKGGWQYIACMVSVKWGVYIMVQNNQLLLLTFGFRMRWL